MEKVSNKFRTLVHRKAATNGSNVPSSLTRQVDPQHQSAFLTVLPFEIRALTYEHVFGNLYIHLTDLGLHLAHIIHKDPVTSPEDPEQVGNVDNSLVAAKYSLLDENRKPTGDKLLALCLTCRRM